jgi:cysteine desulfurase / selenocysteine lyase
MFDIARIRESFPILSRRFANRPLVYFDSAATSLTPEEVIEAEGSFYRRIGANVHRGIHALSEEASDAYEGARHQIARFIGAGSDEVVFTANTTSALNLVADGLDLPADAEILTIASDHHSTLLPWRKRWRVLALEGSPFRPLDPEVLRRAIGPRTKAVVLAHASNVTGLVQPVAELCRVTRDHGCVSVVDAAQSAPHLQLDVRELGCDFLAFSGHKMLGPTGIGVLYGRASAMERLSSPQLGGGMVERVTRHDHKLRSGPGRFEAGTPNIAGALGLSAATRYIETIGLREVQKHGAGLAEAIKSGLTKRAALTLLSAEGDVLPIVSLILKGSAIRPDDVAIALSDRYGIMTRAGLLCAHPLFEGLGLPGGALRVSAYVYNSVEEVDYFCESLAEIMFAFGAR